MLQKQSFQKKLQSKFHSQVRISVGKHLQMVILSAIITLPHSLPLHLRKCKPDITRDQQILLPWVPHYPFWFSYMIMVQCLDREVYKGIRKYISKFRKFQTSSSMSYGVYDALNGKTSMNYTQLPSCISLVLTILFHPKARQLEDARHLTFLSLTCIQDTDMLAYNLGCNG